MTKYVKILTSQKNMLQFIVRNCICSLLLYLVCETTGLPTRSFSNFHFPEVGHHKF